MEWNNYMIAADKKQGRGYTRGLAWRSGEGNLQYLADIDPVGVGNRVEPANSATVV
jgi:hypothetical protein